MSEVVMPRLSDSMEEGTIIKWLKADGDEVARGDELVEIETDKANMTYEADADGVLSIVASEGDTLAIGEVIARLGGEGGDTSGAAPEESPAAPAPAEEAAPRPAEAPAAAPASAAPDEPNGRIKASPVARRMARDQGVDLGQLQGSGPGGRIVKADVEARVRDGGADAPAPAEPPDGAAAASAPAPSGAGAAPATGKGEVRTEELSRTQALIARRMAEAKATVPEFTLTAEVDMEQAAALREELKAVGADGPVPSFNDLIVKACARALREHPRANGAYRDGRFELYDRVNVGVAVAGDDALVVPTVFDADRRSLGEIARETRGLAERVRERSITPPELSGGTFTVSNLGMFGVSDFTAVINPPQAAILAVGAIREVPVVSDGEIVPGRRMSVTLACDHRILYGADAAKFLGRIRELLEHPVALAL